MAEGFRELSPDEDFTPFAKGEFPATYGGPMGAPAAPKAPKGFRELSADEEFIPDNPPLMDRATSAIKSAASSALKYLPGFTAPAPKPAIPNPYTVDDMGSVVTRPMPPVPPVVQPAFPPVAPAPTMPAPPKTYEGRPVVQNPDGSWSHERSMTIEADGKHMNIPTMFGGKQVDPDKAVEIMRNNKWVDPDTGKPVQTFKSQAEALAAAQQKEAAQQQILPPVSPAPAPQAPSLFAGIADRLKSLATPPPRGQMQERPEYTTPTASEPMPAPAGAQRVRIQNEAAKGWKARLGSIAQAAGDYFGAEPAHPFDITEGETLATGPIGQAGHRVLQGPVGGAIESTLKGLSRAAPFPGVIRSIVAPETITPEEKHTGALLQPLPEILTDPIQRTIAGLRKLDPDLGKSAEDLLMSLPQMHGAGAAIMQGIRNIPTAARMVGRGFSMREPAPGAPNPLWSMTPEEAAIAARLASVADDAFLERVVKSMSNNDPRYEFYYNELQSRRAGGGRPQAPTTPAQPGGQQPAGPTGGLLPEGPIEPAPPAPAAAGPLVPKPKGPAPAAPAAPAEQPLHPLAAFRPETQAAAMEQQAAATQPAGFTELPAGTKIEPLGKAPAVTSPKEPPEVSQAVVDEMKRGLAEEKPVGVPPSPLTPEQQRMAAKVAPVTGPKPEAQVASAEGAKERLGELEGKKAGGELWAGTVDAKTGAITSRYTKQQAQDADWHHNMYMSAADLKAVEQGQRHIFYMGAEGEPVFTAHGRDLTPEENKFLSERFTPPAEAKEPITEETKTSVPEAKPEPRGWATSLEYLTNRWKELQDIARQHDRDKQPNRSAQAYSTAKNIENEIREKYGGDAVTKMIGDWKAEQARPKSTEEIVDKAKAEQSARDAAKAKAAERVEKAKEPAPAETIPKGTEPEIGQAVRVMQVDAELAKKETVGGMRYELWHGRVGRDNRAAIRVVDVDSGNATDIVRHPNKESADAAFAKTVEAARKTSGEPEVQAPTAAEAKPKEPTAAEAKIAALEEEQRQLKEKLGKRETAKAKAEERVKAAKGVVKEPIYFEMQNGRLKATIKPTYYVNGKPQQPFEVNGKIVIGTDELQKEFPLVYDRIAKDHPELIPQAVDTEAAKPQIEAAEEGPKDVRQPIKGPSPVDVRQRAGVREGAGGEEAATGTGEEYPEPSDTGDYVDEQTAGAGEELPGGIRPSTPVRHPQGRPGVHRPGEAGAPVAGRPAENIEGAGGPGGVPGPPGEAQPEVTERNADKNYVLSRDYDWIPEGAKSRIRANLAAIKLVKKLQAENLFATSDEKGILAKYTGWGAFPQMFDEGKAAYRTRPGTTQQQITEAANWEKNWGALYDEVKAALTPEERTAASRSIRNAHYTSREVVNGVWAGLEKLGFKGGKALEPAVGSGNIVGLTPEKLRNKIDWKAIELDNISAAIAQKLYPEATVVHNGFQNVPLQRDYDLVVTNVPFAAEGPSEHNPRRLSLHNFFIDRSINELKPGGIAALITSDSTMDRAISESARRLFSEKADLVGAIRLPNTAFAENAGTEVTTDILFFRKKDDLSYSGQFKGEPFIETKAGQTYKGEPVNINEYFVDHPDMMLGRMSLEGKMYRRPGAGEVPDQSMQALLPNVDEAGEPLPLGPQLEKAMQKLPKLPKGAGQILDEMVGKVPELPQAEKVAGKEYKPGSFALDKAGDVKFINDQGQYETPEWSNDPKKVAQAKKYIALRDAALDLINKEASDVSDASLEPARRQLNKLYDDYVKNYGPTNDKATRLFEDDYHFNTPITLEKEVNKIVERRNLKGDLIPTKKTSYVKETIFSKRAGFHHQEPQSADTVEEGLDLSMNQKGGVDTKYIAQLTGKDVETVEAALRRSGAAFENPKTKKWEDRTEYLSGFTKLKLRDAQKAAEKDRRFQTNVDELEKVQPEPIAIENITTNIGSDWIPKEQYQNFIQDTLGVRARVNYTPTTSTWEIQPQGGGDELRNEANTTVYGVRGDTEVTPGEQPEDIVPKSGVAILNDMLNGRQTEVQKRIYVTDPMSGREDIRYRKSEKKTLEAQEKRRQLQQKFNEFTRADDARIKELETIYNEKKNIAVLPDFPVPTLKIYPGANPDIPLRDDQKKDVSRMLRNSVGIFQAPGNGKTFIAATAGMELKRLGLAKKVLYIVHNATAEQAPVAVKRLYPAANVLAPTKRDFEAQNRQRLLSRIATGDYDMIIIPQSFANLIPDDPIRMIGYVHDRLAELRAAIIEAKRAGGDKSPTAKNLQKKVDALEKRLTAIQKLRKDKGLTFEQLGIDAIITDEAHEYKSLDFDTQMGNIKGLANQGGDRGKYALSMYMKFRHVQEKTGGRNTYFLTGTPINNTIGEAWTMMRFLRPDVLEAYGIKNFDQFAAQFGRIATKPEFTAAGTWQEVTRFEGFENAPTILKAWLETASVVTSDMIDLPGLPSIKGGKVRGVAIQQTPEFQKYIKYLRRRLEDFAAMDGKAKRQFSYIPVVTQGLGAKASLDMRMVDPTAPDRPESKLSVAAKDIYDIYKETTPVKGTQMVFADTRYDDPEEQNFDLYKDLQRKLIKHGIPEKEIVIMEDNIQGARRAAVFEAFGRGEIRVVIGHSQRMGVGVDAPQHGVGVHDLDAPHQPMFIEQRHARLVRQGNVVALKRGVDVVTYGVEGSLDAARWQRLSGKQRAFDQLMRGQSKGKFVADPLNELEFSFQEQLALYSGDPRAAEKVQLETAVRQMQGLKKSHEQSVRRAKERLPELEKDIPEQKAKIKSAETDAKRLANAFQDPNAIDLQIAGSSYKGTPSDFRGEKPKHPILSNFFDAEIKSVPKGEGDYHGPQKKAFTINGVPVITEVYTPAEGLSRYDRREPKRLYEDTVVHWRFDVPNAGWRQAAGPNGFFTGLGNELTSIADEPQRFSDKLAVMERNQRELQGFGKQPFEREAELQKSTKRLEELTQELQAAGPGKEPSLAELEADEDAIQHYALMDAERRLKYSQRNLATWERKQPKDEDAATEQEKQIAKLTLRVQEAETDIEEIRAGHRKRDLTKIKGGGKLEEAIKVAEEAETAEEKARKGEGERGSIGLPGGGGQAPITPGGLAGYLARDKTPRDLTRSTIREFSGERMRRDAQTEHALEAEIKRWDKMPRGASLRFIDAIEAGRPQGPQPTGGRVMPADANQRLADGLRAALDEARDQVQALGTGKLENFIENYFPHIWSQPSQAAKIFAVLRGKRPLEGPASFLKRRTIPTTADGVAAGLTPVTYNPVRLALYKIGEMNRYVMAHRIKDQLIKEGLAKFVRFGKKPPPGWKQLDDKIFRVLQYSEAEKGFINRGSYYAPPDAAKSFNNYLSPGLGGSVLYQTARKLGNTLNQAQLGFSFFHLGFTSIDAMTSDVALAIEQAVRGELGKAGKSLGRAPIGPFANWLVGNRLLKEYLSPGSYAKFSEEADALAQAGGRPFMDLQYKNQAIESFWRSWKEGDFARVGLKAFPAAMEALSKPVMEYIVPRQKLGVFAKLATDILDRADRENWSEQRRKQEIQKAWDSVDNRMGQLVYDNLFWNKVVKDLGMVGVRSLGWNIGTVREVGGGATDFIMQAAKMARGKRPEMTHRMAYLLALPITVGFLGAIYSYLATGEAPRNMRDYFFPRTGSKDAAGRDERVSLPSYMKDIYAFAHHPLATIGHKVHPAVSAIIEMLNNEDFYGTELRHPDDPIVKQVWDMMKYVANLFTPFSVRNAQQRAKAGGETSMFGPGQASKTAQSFVGITPAPVSISKTDAEEVAGEFLRRRVPGGGKTQAQTELRDTAKLIEQRYALGKITAAQVFTAARQGGLTMNQARYIVREAKQPYLVRSVKRLTLEESLKVWDVATPDERQQIKRMVLQKRKTLRNMNPEARKRVIAKLRATEGLRNAPPEPAGNDEAINE